MEAPSSSRLGKKRVEWDLNNWKWDGHEFLATPLNINKSHCPENLSQVIDFGDIDRKRKTIVIEDDEFDTNIGNCGGNMTLNLFGNSARTSEVLQVGVRNRSPSCQVEGCNADLKCAKDYHRRHKVCEIHSKAASAMVNNAVQRFCQQCSRFHHLTEFDEERRSCRRRLDGHNKRRRKTNQGSTNNGHSTIDNQATYYLLISLLQVLSSLHSGTTNQSKDHELVSQILQTLATVADSVDASSFSALLQAIQDTQKLARSAEITSEVPDGITTSSIHEQTSAKEQPLIRKPVSCVPSLNGTDISVRKQYTEALPDSCIEKAKYKEFDLNNTCSDTENCNDRNNIGAGSPISPSCILQDSHESSPQHMSGDNSDSTSVQPQSLSVGDSKSRTCKIVFKLFGKDPNDLPPHLRSQILDWLCNSPTDIESYIRPGCIILTIYLHQTESAWGELCSNLFSNLNRLFYSSSCSFWRTGWIYARIQEHVSFIYNGKILLSTPMVLRSPCLYEITSVSPLAVAISSRVKFTVKGFNLAQSTARLLCAYEGNYLAQETTENTAENGSNHDDVQCLSFTCILPNKIGRGFIEVEDDCLGSSFFPFIVAKHDICSEIRTLEKLIEVSSLQDDLMDARTEALNFLHEIGWLLRQKQLKSTCSNTYFSLIRFKWLIGFAMDQDWHAVVKHLLDILFEGSIIDTDGASPNEIALKEYLLQTAVCKNSRSMVEAMLRYKPVNSDAFLFRPDLPLDHTSITPLHAAASIIGSESVLDALTDDPGQFGLKAWKTARDITGLTPEDYARSKGHESYLNLVQKKIDRQQVNDKSHIIAIPHVIFSKLQAFETEKRGSASCKSCSQQMMHRPIVARPFLYRPTMLSMVAIAAVCVCVGLLFKGPPEVFGVVHPFRWEKLRYGSM